MGGFSNWPSFDSFIAQCWGPGVEVIGALLPGAASNIVSGTNPPYYINDFLAFYPKFGGCPLLITGTTAQGSATVAAVPLTVGCASGQLISGPGIPPNTVITAVTPNAGSTPGSLIISQVATANGTSIGLSVFEAPLVPMVVANAYIALASASLVQARYKDSWAIAMSYYIAHWVTLYLLSDGNRYCTAGEAATAGLARGITISKGAGPVSQGLKTIDSFDEWGSFALTIYGQNFVSIARIIGMGPSLIW